MRDLGVMRYEGMTRDQRWSNERVGAKGAKPDGQGSDEAAKREQRGSDTDQREMCRGSLCPRV